MSGTLIYVVGPSGAGKDTLIRAALRARPDIAGVRRIITRSPDDETEASIGVGADTFEQMRAAGEFILCWHAHGLRYGVPVGVRETLAGGRHALLNGSRAMVDAARAAFDPLRILSISAPMAVLAQRLPERGREDKAEIAARLERAALRGPSGADVRDIPNGGTLEQGLAAFLSALPPPTESA